MKDIQDMQEMIRQLNQGGKRLSKGHRKIVEYILAHYDKAVFMTASKLGEMVGVSESTVVRFAAALGYDGYPQLQRALQELVRHRLTTVQRFEMVSDIEQDEVLKTVLKADIQNLRTTMEESNPTAFDQVVECLLKAKRIYVLGVRSAAPLAQFMGYYLQFIFDNVRVVGESTNDVFEQISRIAGGDVLFGISFPRYSNRTLDAMHFAKARGADVVALTDGPMSPLKEPATYFLTARTDMASFVDSLAAPLSMINALIVALGLRRKEELSKHFELMEGIWDEYRVYIGKDR